MLSDEGVLALSQACQDRFSKLEEECNKKNETAEAQLSILNEFGQSYKDYEKLEQKMQEIEEDLEKTDKEINTAQNFLNQIIKDKIEFRNQSECSDMVKLIMSSNIKNITDAVQSCIDNKKTSASIFSILEIENNLATLIEKLKDQHMYPIDPKDDTEMNERVRDHNNKILNFLQKVVQAN